MFVGSQSAGVTHCEGRALRGWAKHCGGRSRTVEVTLRGSRTGVCVCVCVCVTHRNGVRLCVRVSVCV